ncbi:hypothetical protein NHX12_030728, partial [Muraenolepis orangiensis]
IGYGKANSTTRLWVGGLGPGISLTALAREFDRFGSIRNIDYVKGESFAYIQYESLDASQAACTQMRGFPLGGPERRLRVDFAKVEESPPRVFPSGYQPPVPLPPHYELLPEAYVHHRSLEREGREARAVRTREGVPRQPAPHSGAEAAGRGGVRQSRARIVHVCVRPTPPRSPQTTPPRRPRVTPTTPGSLSEFAAASLPKSWPGLFALKNSSFPTHLYLLEGGASFFNGVMKGQSQPCQLKIAQRLRMDQTRLDEVARRIKQGRPDGYAVLLALQGPVDRQAPPPQPGLQVRLLRHLVTYLRNKEAAGVISLPAAREGASREGATGAMLYAFPPGHFSQQYLQEAKRTVGSLYPESRTLSLVGVFA